MDQNPGDFDDSNAVNYREGRLAMFAVPVAQTSRQETGARGKGGRAGGIGQITVQKLNLPPQNAVPEAREECHGFRGLDQKRRVERACSNAGMQHR